MCSHNKLNVATAARIEFVYKDIIRPACERAQAHGVILTLMMAVTVHGFCCAIEKGIATLYSQEKEHADAMKETDGNRREAMVAANERIRNMDATLMSITLAFRPLSDVLEAGTTKGIYKLDEAGEIAVTRRFFLNLVESKPKLEPADDIFQKHPRKFTDP